MMSPWEVGFQKWSNKKRQRVFLSIFRSFYFSLCALCIGGGGGGVWGGVMAGGTFRKKQT